MVGVVELVELEVLAVPAALDHLPSVRRNLTLSLNALSVVRAELPIELSIEL